MSTLNRRLVRIEELHAFASPPRDAHARQRAAERFERQLRDMAARMTAQFGEFTPQRHPDAAAVAAMIHERLVALGLRS